jgi:hypothetical protein
MNLTSTSQISDSELSSCDFDVLICASGFEQRATNSLKYLDLNNIESKVAFAFEDRKNQQRDENDIIFRRHNVDLFDISGDSSCEVTNKILDIVNSKKGEHVKIFVDYSSMTRSWYAAIISAIKLISSKSTVECYFGYSPACYEPPPSETMPNELVCPIDGFGGLEAMDLPSALIIGLGYEKDRALGLLEYVDPGVCFAFYTDPPLDAEFSDVLKTNNLRFLNLIGDDNIFKHPLMDIQRTGNLLMSLVWGLKDRYRIILAPLGIKPFCLLCLLLATRYPEIDVWRVTSGTKAGMPNRIAKGPVLVFKAIFTRD